MRHVLGRHRLDRQTKSVLVVVWEAGLYQRLELYRTFRKSLLSFASKDYSSIELVHFVFGRVSSSSHRVPHIQLGSNQLQFLSVSGHRLERPAAPPVLLQALFDVVAGSIRR